MSNARISMGLVYQSRGKKPGTIYNNIARAAKEVDRPEEIATQAQARRRVFRWKSTPIVGRHLGP
jgi:hypothetical protein